MESPLSVRESRLEKVKRGTEGGKEGGGEVVGDLGGSIGKAVGRGGTYTSIGF